MVQNLKYIKATIKNSKISVKFISVKQWTKECLERFGGVPSQNSFSQVKLKDSFILYTRTGNDLKTSVKQLFNKKEI